MDSFLVPWGFDSNHHHLQCFHLLPSYSIHILPSYSKHFIDFFNVDFPGIIQLLHFASTLNNFYDAGKSWACQPHQIKKTAVRPQYWDNRFFVLKKVISIKLQFISKYMNSFEQTWVLFQFTQFNMVFTVSEIFAKY